MPRATSAFVLLACFISCLAPPHARAQSAPAAPLPNAHDLLERALANEKKLAEEQERYECRVRDESVDTDSRGAVKKSTTEVKDQFFVNGIAVERTLSKNGKDLSPDETRKEDQRVMKETVKYSNQATARKETDKQNQQIEDFLTAMMLTSGHRERVNGRSVLFYTIVPNPHFQAKNINQRFAQVMQGTVSMDEESGELIDLNIKSMQDLKIAGGVLANLHKGFWIHVHDQPQSDGVWLTDLAEGSGDARAALFFHPYFRFKETIGDCHLYSTAANPVGQAKVK
ncbi:MAG TPA: hypothetical protein VGG85_04510 [Terracidiphilus sp.]|jgi:hypothetical protein